MSGVRVQVLAGEATVVAEGAVSPWDAFALFTRTRMHRDRVSMQEADGTTVVVLNGLLALPDEMQRRVRTVFASYSYVFGFVLNPDANQPDYFERGVLAAKLVPGELKEPEENRLADVLADVAEFDFGRSPGSVCTQLMPDGTTLLVTEAFRPM